MTFQIPVWRFVVATLAAVVFLGCDPKTPEFGELPETGGSSGDGGGGNGGGNPTGGSGGTGGQSGSGGDGGVLCEAGQPACDGNRATTCSSNGTGYAPGGTVCTESQECTDGACVDKPCVPDELYCADNELRKCAHDGLSHTVEDECGRGEYCNSTDKVCAPQVCSPGTRQCGGGGQPQLCADDGSAWENDGAACSGDNPTCSDGVCVCVPDTERCSPTGKTPQRCSSDNAWVSKEEPCVGAMYTGCKKSGPEQFASAQCITTSVPMNSAPPGEWIRTVGSKTSKTAVDNFRLDKYEVTVGQFRRFVNAYVEGWRPKSGDGKHLHLHNRSGLLDAGPAGGNETGWNTAWTIKLPTTQEEWNRLLMTGGADTPSKYASWAASVGDGSHETLPINLVSWYMSYAYCIWDGGFLPTEAEWEWAARNGNAAWKYPWPNDVVLGSDSKVAVYGCFYPDGQAQGNCTGLMNIAKVDEGPAVAENSNWAHMGGNVWEWTLDSHIGVATDPPSYPADCNNCAILSVPNPGTDVNKTHRGGDFYFTKSELETAAHRAFNGDWTDHFGGVRCARSSNQF